MKLNAGLDLLGDTQDLSVGAEIIAGDYFGKAVSLSLGSEPPWLMVGAPSTDVGRAGRVFVFFKNDVGLWQNIGELTNPLAVSPETIDRFGSQILNEDQYTIISAPSAAENRGAVYIYSFPSRSGGTMHDLESPTGTSTEEIDLNTVWMNAGEFVPDPVLGSFGFGHSLACPSLTSILISGPIRLSDAPPAYPLFYTFNIRNLPAYEMLSASGL
jgi:hypothetical protein